MSQNCSVDFYSHKIVGKIKKTMHFKQKWQIDPSVKLGLNTCLLWKKALHNGTLIKQVITIYISFIGKFL